MAGERVKTRTMAGWTWTTVHLDLENPGDRDSRVTIEREIPRGAVVTGMTIATGGERLVASFHERQWACGIYDDLTFPLTRPRDPAVLELVGPRRIRLQVGPVPPGRSVTVTYTHVEAGDRAPEIGRKIRESTDAVRMRTALGENAFYRVVDTLDYRPERTEIKGIVVRSREEKVLSVFTALLAAPADAMASVRSPGGPTINRYRGDAMLLRLALHQSADGSWDRDGSARGGDAEITGLALLAFLRAGETHRTGRHRDTVKSGLRFLKRIQTEDGAFVPREQPRFAIAHSRAALAMTEVFALTGSPLFKPSAQAASALLIRSRNPDGGWGPRPGRPSTTSATVWCVLVLRSVKEAGVIVVPARAALDEVRPFLDSVVDPGTGCASDRPGVEPESGEAWLTGAAMAARLLTGVDARSDERVTQAIERCLERRPRVDGNPMPIEWYFSAIEISNKGGRLDRTWFRELRGAVAARLVFGCLGPEAPDSPLLGRIGATALMSMAAEVDPRCHVRLVCLFPRNRRQILAGQGS